MSSLAALFWPVFAVLWAVAAIIELLTGGSRTDVMLMIVLSWVALLMGERRG